MKEIITTTRKWGNSVGVLLGSKIESGKTVRILVGEEGVTKVGDVFGKFKLKTPTNILMKKIDKELGL